MAEQHIQFAYNNIELYKSQSLGSGSYGGVCKAKCDGLVCAAKIMHPTLFDFRDPGTTSYLRRFREECHLLSLARHPNVVQYLATYHDPNTQLPVLLMELCDESLTTFLERSPGPLSYHVELNICLDISLALVYLHSNGLIHRDLTGNNVLMIAGARAKVTDFGMSKLATVNPHMTALTLCPGNVLYMSPEALDQAKTYTAKLDIFSFGVIAIQILTRQFPNPSDRFQTIPDPRYGEVRVLVPDFERRQAHLQLISDIHPLKPLALQCLNTKESDRPSALELSERISECKQAPQYSESVQQTQSRSEIQHLVAQKQQLEQQLRGQRILTEAKMREVSEYQAHNAWLQSMMQAKDTQLQEKQHTMEARDRQLQEKHHTIEARDRQIQEKQHLLVANQHAIETKERELQQKQEQLQASEQLVAEFQQSLQQQDKTIGNLQQTISNLEKEIGELKHLASNAPPCNTEPVAQKDIGKIRCREEKKARAPEAMMRGAAVVHGNTAYFRLGNSARIYSYETSLRTEKWSTLPDNPNADCSLAVIDGNLTSVGGYCSDAAYVDGRDYTNILLSLIEEGKLLHWSTVFPPMPTPRSRTACITTEQALVVAGGYSGDYLNTVEVMDINTIQWTAVRPLPYKLSSLSGVALGDSLYLAGGTTGGLWSNSVITCYFPDLWKPGMLSMSNAWKEISPLPVTRSTLALLSSQLVAIGGDFYPGIRTTDIYRYDFHTNSWHVINQMKKRRSQCFAVTLAEDHLMIVGGNTQGTIKTDSVEVLKGT